MVVPYAKISSGIVMRIIFIASTLLLNLSLTSCAVVSVAGTVVATTASVAGTVISTSAAVAGAGIKKVVGSGESDKAEK